MRRAIALLLALMLLLSACGSDSDRSRDDDDRQTNREKPVEEFRLLDDSGSNSLYYYNYTRDYKFNKFLRSGGAEDTEELVEHCLDIFPDMELDLNNLGYGCSSYCAVGKNGDVYFGRNFDNDARLIGDYMIVHTTPRQGYESYSTVSLGFLGVKDVVDPVDDDTSPLLMAPYVPLDGINSEGLAICILQLNTKPVDGDMGNKVDMTPTTIIRNVLDNAADLYEALEIFEDCNFYTEGYAYHFMIADADGNCAVVEYVDDEMVVVHMEDDLLVCANVHVSREGRKFYRVKDGNESDTRVNAITRGIEDADFKLNAKSAMEALAKAHVYTNRWSIVYNLTDGEMFMTVNRRLDPVYEFDFD